MPSFLTFFRTLVLVLSLLLLSMRAVAADVIRVPDLVTLQEGEVRRIQITGTVESTAPGRITLQYPADIFHIRQVVGGAGFAWNCPSILVNSNTITGAVGVIEVQCTDVRRVTDQPIFEIEVEAHYGGPRTGPLQPVMLVVGGDTVENAQLIGGQVELVGSGLQQREFEGITGNYPNPFSTSTTLVYTMLEAGKVTFRVRNIVGRLVMEITDIDATAGENTFLFEPHQEELAQGTYLLELITDREVYHHSFMVLR